VAEPEHGGDEHVEQALLGLDVVGQEPLLEAEAGVVDQQVDRPRRIRQPRLHQGQLRPVGQVGGHDLHVDVVLVPECLGDRLQPLPVPRDQHEVVAAAGELGGERVADSGGGAGDQGGRHASSKLCRRDLGNPVGQNVPR
jgi:hypothetical protein